RWNLLVRRDDPTVVPARSVVVAGDRALAIVVRPGRPLVVFVEEAADTPVLEATVSAHVDADAAAVDYDKTNVAGRADLAVPLDAPLVVRVVKDGYEPFEKKDVRPTDEPLRVVLVKSTPR